MVASVACAPGAVQVESGDWLAVAVFVAEELGVHRSLAKVLFGP